MADERLEYLCDIIDVDDPGNSLRSDALACAEGLTETLTQRGVDGWTLVTTIQGSPPTRSRHAWRLYAVFARPYRSPEERQLDTLRGRFGRIGDGRMTRTTVLQLTPECRGLVTLLRARLGLSAASDVLEIAMRELARSHAVEVPEDDALYDLDDLG